jgi:outer membrane protein assembly factor BamB/tRNA A-37 threonylcarbamoyl transferase component Bud32
MKPRNNTDSEGLVLETGTRLADRYLIQNVIKVSQISAVYQARDLHFPNVVKFVAVKEILNETPDAQDREERVQGFERQANLLATLSHPAIPGVLDYFTEGRHSYLILEFIVGKTLETLLDEGGDSLPVDSVVQWSIGICEVLEYLHSHQPEAIIFANLNPANIMLNQHGQVMLIDFGIAIPFQSTPGDVPTAPKGYSPPEQYQGEVSPRVDIYANSQVEVINPEVPPELVKVITTAIQIDANNRYQDAAEMKTALLGVLGRSDSRQLTPQYDSVIPIPENTIQPIWTYSCADEIRGTAAYERKVVYIGSYDKHLHALNAETGELIWKYQTDGGIVSRPTIMEDSVFIGSEDHRLHVVSVRQGSLLWTYYTKGAVRSSPRAAHGHIFLGSDDGGVHAINISGGRGIWQIETSAEVRSTPFVTQEAVYVGNEAGEFYCFDFRGGIKWRFKAKRAITSSALVADNLVIFSSLDSNLYALDAKSGYLVWRFQMDKGSISSPFVADGLVFCGSIDGNIYSVDLDTAKEVWRFQTDHQVTSSPIVLADSLYCGSVDGHLYCLDHQTGQLRWKFNTGSAITATPVVNNSTIFIGSTDNKLYALPATTAS